MSEPTLLNVARAICEAGNVPGFRCVCPHPIDGWCLGGRLKVQAEAAIRALAAPSGEEDDGHQWCSSCGDIGDGDTHNPGCVLDAAPSGGTDAGLVERLRHGNPRLDDIWELRTEAADAIERLIRERDEARTNAEHFRQSQYALEQRVLDLTQELTIEAAAHSGKLRRAEEAEAALAAAQAERDELKFALDDVDLALAEGAHSGTARARAICNWIGNCYGEQADRKTALAVIERLTGELAREADLADMSNAELERVRGALDRLALELGPPPYQDRWHQGAYATIRDVRAALTPAAGEP